ncbi:hypothetical protein Tco_1352561 [Tanacetum coccineum]
MHFWGYKANVPLGYLIETCRASSRGPERQKLSSNFLHPHDERSPVVKWEVSRFEQVPIQVSRQVTPLVQNTQEVYEEGRLPLDYSSRRSFHAAQAAYSSTSHASPLHPTREEFIMYLPPKDIFIIFPGAPNSGNHESTTSNSVISKPDASGGVLQKWSVLAREHNISYETTHRSE